MGTDTKVDEPDIGWFKPPEPDLSWFKPPAEPVKQEEPDLSWFKPPEKSTPPMGGIQPWELQYGVAEFPNAVGPRKKPTKGMGTLKDWAQAVRSSAGGLVSWIPGSFAAGIAAVGTPKSPALPPDIAEQFGQYVSEKITGTPETESGKDIAEGLSVVPNTVFGPINALEKPLPPAARIALNAMMAGLTLKGLIKKSGGTIPKEVSPEAELTSEAPKVAAEPTKGEALIQKMAADQEQLSPQLAKSYDEYAYKVVSEKAAQKLFEEEGIPKEETLAKLKAAEVQPIEQTPPAEVTAAPSPTLDQPVGKQPMGGGMTPDMMPKEVGGVRIDKALVDWDAKNLMAEQSAHLAMEGKKTMTWAEIEQGAKNTGLTLEQLQKKTLEGTEIAVEATRETYARLLQDSGQARIAASADPTVENQAAFDISLARAWDFARLKKGQESTLGRSLGLLRKEYGPDVDITTKMQQRAIKHFQDAGLDYGEFKDKIQGLDWNNPSEIGKFIADTAGVKWKDFVGPGALTRWKSAMYQVYVNSLLSGTATPIIKFVSDLGMFLESPLEKAVGGAPKEALWQTRGMLSGITNGVKKMAWIMKTGVNLDPIGDVEFRSLNAIPGKLGRVVDVPTGLLKSITSGFQTPHYMGSIYAQAYRMASEMLKKGKITGDQVAATIDKYISTPTREMMDVASKEAKFRTFQANLGPMGQSLVNVRNQAGLAGKILVPFYKTPANFTKLGLDFTPFDLPLELKKSFAKNLTPGERAAFRGRVVIGATLTAAALDLASKGLITGSGPSDPKQRALLMQQGWQEKSVKVGGKYISYGRGEPWAIPFALVADAWDIWHGLNNAQRENLFKRISFAFGKDVLDRTFFGTVSDFMNAIDEPGRYGTNVAKRFAGSAIPTIVAQTAKAVDPYVRDTYTILDYMKSRIPGQSFSLNPKLDVAGQPIKRGGGPSIPFLPTAVSDIKPDPVGAELERLGIGIGKPPKVMKHGPATFTPSADAYYDLTEKERTGAWAMLSKWMDSPAYQNFDDTRKKMMAQKILSGYHQIIRGRTLAEGLNR